jgi:hypothetical protein
VTGLVLVLNAMFNYGWFADGVDHLARDLLKGDVATLNCKKC